MTSINKLILRYSIFVGIPFLVAKQIKKYPVKRLGQEVERELSKELKDFSEIKNISDGTHKGLNTREGANPILI